MQVAGRAGRADRPGEVLIQTSFPDHSLYRAVKHQDYEDFAQRALAERQEAQFPPYAYQTLLRAEAVQRAAVDRFLGSAAQSARRVAHAVTVYDPVPAPVPKVAGRERGHLLVQAQAREDLQRFLDMWEPMLNAEPARQVRWVLDVDPLDL
jgi:primosomal protein N' (replication factor Y)